MCHRVGFSPSGGAVGRVLGDDDALAELGVEVDVEVPPLEQLPLDRRPSQLHRDARFG